MKDALRGRCNNWTFIRRDGWGGVTEGTPDSNDDGRVCGWCGASLQAQWVAQNVQRLGALNI